MYKKIYLEITNTCNLNCPFCLKSKRKVTNITLDNYKYILNKLYSYTKYLYLHVSGEPLMHPNINEFIDIGSKDFFINITTNGYLIDKISNNHNIRQINISMHSYSETYNISIDEYLNNIINSINKLKKYTYISLRFWVDNKYTNYMINYLEEYYKTKIELKNNFKVTDNIFISINKEFIWPDINNNYYNETGTCYALKDHIGILSDGTIIPCCLDVCGNIKLGNIYEDNLSDVINSAKYKAMLDGFKCNKKIEELCRHCNFLE